MNQEEKEMLRKVVNEISYIHESNSKSLSALKEMTLYLMAIKNLMIEKNVISEEELKDQINKIKKNY